MHLSERQTAILHRARALGRVEVEALAAGVRGDDPDDPA